MTPDPRRQPGWPFCDFNSGDGSLYISDPVSCDPKNVTYNAFRFSQIQQEFAGLHDTLGQIEAEEQLPPALPGKTDENFFIKLFGRGPCLDVGSD